MTFLQKIIHYLGQSIGSLLRVFKWHHKKPKSNLISSEESNKMSLKTPSQDLNYSLEECYDAYKEPPCENWNDYAGG
jgi:hypothetical protein